MNLSGSQQNKKILVVGDSADSIKDLLLSLSLSDECLHSASNGLTALLEVAEWEPDLIITDAAVPIMSRIELCRGVRAISKTPIIILSSESGAPCEVDVGNVGVSDFTEDTIDLPELLSRINEYLSCQPNSIAKSKTVS